MLQSSEYTDILRVSNQTRGDKRKVNFIGERDAQLSLKSKDHINRAKLGTQPSKLTGIAFEDQSNSIHDSIFCNVRYENGLQKRKFHLKISIF